MHLSLFLVLWYQVRVNILVIFFFLTVALETLSHWETKAEWIDVQAENEGFDMFTDSVRNHMENIKDIAMKAIEAYKAEKGADAADVD